jgi:serine/threonine protein kinase/tetratricopeptide (TPR) repeat protein
MSGSGGGFRSSLSKGAEMAPFDVRRWNRASQHLDGLLDLSPIEKEAALAALRVTHPEAAEDVRVLLDAHRRLTSEGFLEADVTIRPAGGASVGLAVGPYELTEPIGQGGMGSVWRAARNDGRFEGTVAVKLLNTELVGQAGNERFTREGHILARLTHPNIARLLDAGVAASGQPFLVLELVDGEQIDRYCDSHGYRVDARLNLFLDVLAAVAHAHRNLIVHRDLKPSNVLVTKDGGVKLLDFGIAKLLDAEPGNDTPPVLTRGHGALTPKYAAPEQVYGGVITTATDVYALGVLLYELLSGAHPAGDSDSTAGLMKSILETEPPRLSDAAPLHARGALRGDVETIVGKAMKKRPDERYASVAEFAEDVRRYLHHQPIGARPDTLRYRTGKFIRRQRGPLAIAALVLLTIGGVVGFYTVQLTRERDRAAVQAQKSARMTELLTSLLRGADPYRTPDGKITEPTVRSLLDAGAERVRSELADQPELQAEMFDVIGRTYERMGLHDKSFPLLEEALAIGRRLPGGDPLKLAQSLNDLGVLKRNTGDVSGAEPLLRESLTIRRAQLGANANEVAITLVELARVLNERGRQDEAEPMIREALDIRTRLYGPEHRDTATSQNDLGLLLWRQGKLDEAERLLREHLATSTRLLGEAHPSTASALNNLGLVLNAKGDRPAAEALLRRAAAVDARTAGKNHPNYANALNNLAVVVRDQGRLDEAAALIEESLSIAQPMFGDAHPRVSIYLVTQARIRLLRGELAAAEAAFRQAMELRAKLYAADDWRIGQIKALLGAALAAQHRDAEAKPLLLEAVRLLKDVPGPQGEDAAFARRQLAALR